MFINTTTQQLISGSITFNSSSISVQPTTGITIGINTSVYTSGYTSLYYTDEEYEINEKFIKEKNFSTLNENCYYITNINNKVYIKKNNFNEWYNVYDAQTNKEYYGLFINKYGYVNNHRTLELFLVKEIPSLKQKIDLL